MGKMSTIEKVEEKASTELIQPSMYKVILNNDDYTPMDFVVEILRIFFSKTEEQAVEIMLMVHHQGRAICGIYPFGVAETKVMQVNQYARDSQHPLLCTLEKA